MTQLLDSFGRIATNLRISVTDRCNMRCRYCMPLEGLSWLPKDQILNYEEIERLARIFVDLGVDKIRLTGGEPLVRRDLPNLVTKLAGIEGLKDIGMTTNGFYLAEYANALEKAGLSRINVSLDSLVPETFERIVRRDYFHQVIEGLRAVSATGMRPIKVNIVLLRGINDNEIEDFGLLARERGFIIRFIEFMPIGKDDGWSINRVVSTAEVKSVLQNIAPLIPLDSNPHYPAERFAFADGLGEVGFISSVTEPFCGNCNRIRLTSDGKLRNCLFAVAETDLLTPLRAGASDARIARLILKNVAQKWSGHMINHIGFVRPDRTMSSIGG